ncbi:MAG TPA: hypothetical protein VM534_04185 [Thermoanaerobaculia bacterium]|nr:hypothetical protein [Thermoanaerobaculia bacterium]
MNPVRSLLPLGLIAVWIASGCASSGPSLIEPEIAIVQLPGSEFQIQMGGPVSVGYRMLIRNVSGEPITFLRLELQTMGGGPYVIRHPPVHFREAIAPGQERVVTFMVNAYSSGGRVAATEPVVLRGLAQFEGPDGVFRTVFTRRISQSGAGGVR